MMHQGLTQCTCFWSLLEFEWCFRFTRSVLGSPSVRVKEAEDGYHCGCNGEVVHMWWCATGVKTHWGSLASLDFQSNPSLRRGVKWAVCWFRRSHPGLGNGVSRQERVQKVSIASNWRRSHPGLGSGVSRQESVQSTLGCEKMKTLSVRLLVWGGWRAEASTSIPRRGRVQKVLQWSDWADHEAILPSLTCSTWSSLRGSVEAYMIWEYLVVIQEEEQISYEAQWEDVEAISNAASRVEVVGTTVWSILSWRLQ